MIKVDQFAIVSGCLLVATSSSQAQESITSSNLEGWVIDSTGISIAAANVVVNSSSLQGTRGTTSDNNGLFRILYLPPGDYTIRISHVSFRPQVFVNVRILLGRTTGLGDIRLTEMTYDMKEIVIQAEQPFIDSTSVTTGANLLRRDFELLPIERNYLSAVSILPHTNQSYFGDEVNTGGASGAENRYFLDGNDVTDPFRGIAVPTYPTILSRKSR